MQLLRPRSTYDTATSLGKQELEQPKIFVPLKDDEDPKTNRVLTLGKKIIIIYGVKNVEVSKALLH